MRRSLNVCWLLVQVWEGMKGEHWWQSLSLFSCFKLWEIRTLTQSYSWSSSSSCCCQKILFLPASCVLERLVAVQWTARKSSILWFWGTRYWLTLKHCGKLVTKLWNCIEGMGTGPFAPSFVSFAPFLVRWLKIWFSCYPLICDSLNSTRISLFLSCHSVYFWQFPLELSNSFTPAAHRNQSHTEQCLSSSLNTTGGFPGTVLSVFYWVSFSAPSGVLWLRTA